jgi:hypothetical protein
MMFTSGSAQTGYRVIKLMNLPADAGHRKDQTNEPRHSTTSLGPADAGFGSAVPDNYRTPGSFRQIETGIGPSTSEVLRTLSAMERLLLN